MADEPGCAHSPSHTPATWGSNNAPIPAAVFSIRNNFLKTEWFYILSFFNCLMSLINCSISN
jgi:hypothetical protein